MDSFLQWWHWVDFRSERPALRVWPEIPHKKSVSKQNSPHTRCDLPTKGWAHMQCTRSVKWHITCKVFWQETYSLTRRWAPVQWKKPVRSTENPLDAISTQRTRKATHQIKTNWSTKAFTRFTPKRSYTHMLGSLQNCTSIHQIIQLPNFMNPTYQLISFTEYHEPLCRLRPFGLKLICRCHQWRETCWNRPKTWYWELQWWSWTHKELATISTIPTSTTMKLMMNTRAYLSTFTMQSGACRIYIGKFIKESQQSLIHDLQKGK